MTEESRELFEELTKDCLTDARNLDLYDERGKIIFSETERVLDLQYKFAQLDAQKAEAEAKEAAEKRAMVADICKWGVGLTVTAMVTPVIQNVLNKDLAQTFARLEKEDFYSTTPWKSLKGLFKFK